MDLERIRRLVVSQAAIKNWSTRDEFLKKRINQELEEFEIEIKKKNPELAALELIDVNYFLIQRFHNLDPHYKLNLDTIFKMKYDANWKQKKKTENEKGDPVLR